MHTKFLDRILSQPVRYKKTAHDVPTIGTIKSTANRGYYVMSFGKGSQPVLFWHEDVDLDGEGTFILIQSEEAQGHV